MRYILEDIPMVGGSAGDGMAFRATHVLHDGRFRSDCAVLALLTSRRALKPFRNHYHRAGEKLAVVTRVDPSTRKVQELNGEPAALEYAALVGVGVDELSAEVFAEYPFMVRVGGEYYARAIMCAEVDGSLVFHSAITRGLVLRLGHAAERIVSLTTELEESSGGASKWDAVLAFDSVQNWIETEAAGQSPALREIHGRHRFVGFHTYGEQFRELHLNRGLVGLAIGKQPLC
jgi:hypothetical protein